MGMLLPRISCVTTLFLLVSFSVAQHVSPRPLITRPVDESQLTTLKGNIHPLAQAKFDVAAAPPDLPMNRMLLVLKRSPEQEHALITMLDNQQDRASPQYHKWLQPDEFGKQFGPSDQDLQIVTGWLQSHGFEINRVSHGRTVIEFSGVEAQVEEALHTSIHKYVVNGEEHWANASDPQIPTALVPVVAGVWSLHDFRKKPHVHYSAAPIAFERSPKGQVTFPNPPGADIHALGPQDYATIYNINPVYQSGINGQGKTIGVVGRSTFDTFDVSDFINLFQLCSSVCPSVSVTSDGPEPLPSVDPAEQVEATLDTTWSAAIAPGANVNFVLSASTNTTDGVDLSELYIVDNNVANIMTESFGTCEAGYTSSDAQGFSLLAEQAAAQGITYLVSAGDTGAEGCDFQTETVAQGPESVNILASTPYTVAVGGTMFSEGGNDSKFWSSDLQSIETALSYISEDVWNESCTVAQCGQQNANILAGGGGVSTFFAKPAWQSPLLWPSLNIPNDGFRDVPDVALTAAGHDPYLLCVFGSCSNNFIYFVYGTSAAAPSFAGIMALVDQSLNNSQGQSVGQADYVLYSLASKQTYSQCNGSNGLPAGNPCVFNDVTVGNNAVPGESSYGSSSPQYSAGVAYDLATGLGSVNVENLVHAWDLALFNASQTTLSVNSGHAVSVVHGTNIPFTVTVSGNSGTPTGDVSLVSASPNAGIGPFSLSSGSVSAQTNLLPGGSYNLVAQYPGDGKFAPSQSSPVSVTITAESSTTTVQALTPTPIGTFPPQVNEATPMTAFTSGPYGTYVYLSASVVGTSQVGTPTGLLYFYDTGTGFYSASEYLNSKGNASIPVFTFGPGPHSVTANYNGDSSFNYGNSNSSPVTFTITQAPTTATITSAGAPSGATFTAVVSTNSGGNPPTGTVNFSVNNAQVGSGALTGMQYSFDPKTGAFIGAQGVATFTDSQLANGQYTVSATYTPTGDPNYLASISSPTTINIQPDFSIQASTNAIGIQSPGGSGFMTIQMTDLDGFNGSVNFSCSGLPTGANCTFSPATLSATGMTNLSVTTTAGSAMLAPAVHGHNWSLAFAMFGMIFGGAVLLGAPRADRRRKVLLSILLGAMCVSCGSGSGSGNKTPPPAPATPAGTYTITITAASGSTTHSTQFYLGVF